MEHCGRVVDENRRNAEISQVCPGPFLPTDRAFQCFLHFPGLWVNTCIPQNDLGPTAPRKSLFADNWFSSVLSSLTNSACLFRYSDHALTPIYVGPNCVLDGSRNSDKLEGVLGYQSVVFFGRSQTPFHFAPIQQLPPSLGLW